MRQCIICGTEIKASMGFTLARDIINRRDPIREICGKCGLVILEMNEAQLIEHIEGCLSGLKERLAKASRVTPP